MNSKFSSSTSPRYNQFGIVKPQHPMKDFYADPLGVRGDIYVSRETQGIYQKGGQHKESPDDTFYETFKQYEGQELKPQTKGAPLVAAAASKSSSAAASTSSSQAMQHQAISAGGSIANTATQGVFSFLNTRSAGDLQKQYIQNASGRGEFGTSFHTGLHSNIKYQAQMQTLNERENIMKLTSAAAGPLGAIAGFFGSKLHTSNAEKNMDFNTAWSSRGGRANPSERSTTTPRMTTEQIRERPPQQEASSYFSQNPSTSFSSFAKPYHQPVNRMNEGTLIGEFAQKPDSVYYNKKDDRTFTHAKQQNGEMDTFTTNENKINVPEVGETTV